MGPPGDDLPRTPRILSAALLLYTHFRVKELHSSLLNIALQHLNVFITFIQLHFLIKEFYFANLICDFKVAFNQIYPVT
jgi:hypothetical protein